MTHQVDKLMHYEPPNQCYASKFIHFHHMDHA